MEMTFLNETVGMLFVSEYCYFRFQALSWLLFSMITWLYLKIDFTFARVELLFTFYVSNWLITNQSCLVCLQLLSARDMAQKTFIGRDRIVYSTDKDLFEQDYEAQEWDQRFREMEKSDWESINSCLKKIHSGRICMYSVCFLREKERRDMWFVFIFAVHVYHVQTRCWFGV